MRLNGFTLAEVLVTLGIIGVVAAMTLPALIQKQEEKSNAAKLLKFATTLCQAVNKYRAETECTGNFSDCMSGNYDSQCKNFAPIAKNMKIIDSITRSNDLSKVAWLPDKAYNYYGAEQTGSYGGVSKITISDCAYLLSDGTIFSIDINPTNFDIIVDVNGKKRPNRVGRDIFFFKVGGDANFGTGGGNTGLTKDVYPYPLGNQYNVYSGICKFNSAASKCNAENLNPTIQNGASPTAYVILTHKIPPLWQ